MVHDEKLRADRLVFYENDVERLDEKLDSFLELSGAHCALLIDKEGHLVTRRGEPLDAPIDSITALIAGSFAATREMARLLGEKQFTTMFHQGERDSVQLYLVGDRTLFVMLFDQRTNLGLVRFYAQETVHHLAEIFKELANREPPENDGLSPDFGADAASALDDLF